MISDPKFKLTRIVTLALLLLSGLAEAQADTPNNLSDLSGRQLWLVDTRQAPANDADVSQVDRLKIWRSGPDSQWCRASLPELLGTDDPAMTTLFYVHENRVSRAESFNRAGVVFGNLSRRIPSGQSFRMVALSWPSDRIGRKPRRDAQIKAKRSEAHGLYLAWLIDQINPDVPVGIFGISYGPRLISAALHYLGGGSIDGRCLPARLHPTRKPVRIALGAAALDAHWLRPGQRYGQALTQVEHALLLINPRDRVLRWYPHLYGPGSHGSEALGYVGLGAQRCALSDPDQVIQLNVGGQVAGSHSWTRYEGSPAMMKQILTHLVY